MNRDLLRADLKRDEGVRSRAYKDTVGKLTIGCGRNLTDRGVSDAEIDFMLENDIDIVERELRAAFPWFGGLSEPRQRALANMAFNMGVPRLLNFKRMLDDLKDGRFAEAAAECLDSTWATQVGERAKRIAALIKEG